MFYNIMIVCANSFGFLNFIIAGIAAVAAAFVGAKVMAGVQKKAISSAEQQAINEAATNKRLAEQQLTQQQEVIDTNKEAQKKAEALSEKEITLSAQRSQIDTLTNILAVKRTTTPSQSYQSFSAPQPVSRPKSFIENINSLIHNLLRG